MDTDRQLLILENIGENVPFASRVKQAKKFPITASGIEVLQVNTGRRCNMACAHCHVQAGPDRTETMGRDVFAACLEALGHAKIPAVDITGGAPEMNPHLEWFIREAAGAVKKIIVRSNLAILLEEGYRRYIDLYAEHGVEIVCSLPDCNDARTDRQRGSGTHRRIMEAMRILNRIGYGEPGSGLVLNIVHNPVGAYLPGPQASLEGRYRERLAGESASFNRLLCITNIPIGRYLDYLLRSDNYVDYFTDLCNAFNPAAVDRVMCRTTVSVGWDGRLFDCDFNQMLGLPVDGSAPNTIFRFDPERLSRRMIVTHNHCYACVAGSGSSCGGATIN